MGLIPFLSPIRLSNRMSNFRYHSRRQLLEEMGLLHSAYGLVPTGWGLTTFLATGWLTRAKLRGRLLFPFGFVVPAVVATTSGLTAYTFWMDRVLTKMTKTTRLQKTPLNVLRKKFVYPFIQTDP